MTVQVLKVLQAFMLEPCNEISGSDILKATKLASGTLYPILIRLEVAEWLESRWETDDPKELDRPRKRLYRLTNIGCNRAEAELNSRRGVLKDVWADLYNYF